MCGGRHSIVLPRDGGGGVVVIQWHKSEDESEPYIAVHDMTSSWTSCIAQTSAGGTFQKNREEAQGNLTVLLSVLEASALDSTESAESPSHSYLSNDIFQLREQRPSGEAGKDGSPVAEEPGIFWHASCEALHQNPDRMEEPREGFRH
mmetsp:Transcript_2197/g.3789  ORF Transcript_2197/g.3789 Transcript_2197/m.3789 type:complete len:148 (+) Transcript_2197:247-690(+)